MNINVATNGNGANRIPYAVPSQEKPRGSYDETEWLKYFEKRASTEPRFAGGVHYLNEDFVDVLLRTIPTGARVLEVGAGAGDTLARLPNAVRHGVEFLPSRVDEARNKNPGVEVYLGDALTFSRSERYDAVICDRLGHSVSDVQRLLENLAGHLASRGRILFSCYNYLWQKPVAIAERTGFKIPAPPGNWFSELDLNNLFALAGLEVVKYEDRLVIPYPLGKLSAIANRYLARLPVTRLLTMYRVYVLRRRVEPPKHIPSVSVVVPARNEAGNIPAILSRTPLLGSRTELIFVEGGSTDNTWEAIDEAMKKYRGPLEVSRYRQTGKGKGDATRVGFDRATGDVLMILDADLTVPPEELPKFLDAMTRGLTDYVHGTRLVYPMEDEAMRFLNKLGNIGFSKIFSFLLNQAIKDTLCGTKVLWRDDYQRIADTRHVLGDFDPFGDFDLIFGAARLNLKLMEIPIRYKSRTYGTTNISRFKHGWLLLQMSWVAARKVKFV